MTRNIHHQYIQRCLDIAALGIPKAYPNPMVGAVIVHEGRIIGEGYHQLYGTGHGEVQAINSVLPADRHLLPHSTIYVNLEPCAHYGKTPPCADLIIKEKIPKVILGASFDPNPSVAGKGIAKLRAAGVEVITGVLEQACIDFNRRFFKWMQKKRPYVILKWAETKDGYFAPADASQKWISNPLTKRLTHRWRSEEASILVGTNTALIDNPQLNVRLWAGHSPTRLVIDRSLKIPSTHHLLDQSIPSIIYNENKSIVSDNLSYVKLDFTIDILPQILDHLYTQNIQSVLVEGGSHLLSSFIDADLWDEARVYIGNTTWGKGLPAPILDRRCVVEEEELGGDELVVLRRV